jgi:hypothetical protein
MVYPKLGFILLKLTIGQKKYRFKKMLSSLRGQLTGDWRIIDSFCSEGQTYIDMVSYPEVDKVSYDEKHWRVYIRLFDDFCSPLGKLYSIYIRPTWKGAFRLNTKEENYHDQEIFDLDFIPDAIKMWVINNMNDIFGS